MTVSQSKLSECVSQSVCRYLTDIGETTDQDVQLYSLVISEVEMALLRDVLQFYNGNQSRAATTLGINRATLRKKLKAYGLL